MANADSSSMVAFVLVPLFIVIAALIWSVQSRKAREVLGRWAEREGLEIMEAERRWVRYGPFWLRTNKGQVVFRVTIRDRDGRARVGFVRVGSWFWGLWSDQVTVEWDAVAGREWQ